MVLSRDELIRTLEHEIGIILHLASKVRPNDLDYRPTPKQRSTLELLQYLVIVAPIHLEAALRAAFDLAAWETAWRTGQLSAKAMDLEQVKAAITTQPALFRELLGGLEQADFSAEIEMFGAKASRGWWIVVLVWCHLVAYRMQLFQYLKSCGHEELGTTNLWMGRDA